MDLAVKLINMKVLWITNGPISEHRKLLDNDFNQGGGWMDAAFEKVSKNTNIEIGLATVYPCKSLIKKEKGEIRYYAVPLDLSQGLYDYKNIKNTMYWQKIAADFKPDIVHIWGTEMAHSLCAIDAMPNVPKVVYLQGLMSQIYNHSGAAIDIGTKLKYFSIRSFISERGIHALDKFELFRVKIEREIIQKVGNVILENEWSAINCRVININCNIFRSLLPVNSLFANYDWSLMNKKPHTIFTVAGGYPIKGHHILLKALGIIKKIYPDVKLYIPGYNPLNDDKGLRQLFPTTYTKLIKSIIKKYDLYSNIVYTGKLKPSEMAENLTHCNVFVMPSAIENHSSSLIEAMMVGCPCVSSYVGGVSEYLEHGKNGFLYRYDEPETLAGIIMDLFKNDNLCDSISRQAKLRTRADRQYIDIAKDFTNIYNEILL